MPIRMSDLLSDPVVRRGDPIVLSGADLLDRPIRWLHSSDIYEIAALLRDHVVRLTTGLGLEGRSEAERRTYVRQLAARGVTGFALELCRFFTTAPADMVDEAERLGLPMIGFRALVPFVEVTEAVNSTITDVAVHRLRRVDDVSRGLSEVLADEGGVGELLARLTAVLDRPVTPTGPRGEIVIDAGHARARWRRPDEGPGRDPLPDRVPVVVHGAVWGWLHTRHGDGDRLVGQAALERAAEIVALGHSPTASRSPASRRRDHRSAPSRSWCTAQRRRGSSCGSPARWRRARTSPTRPCSVPSGRRCGRTTWTAWHATSVSSSDR